MPAFRRAILACSFLLLAASTAVAQERGQAAERAAKSLLTPATEAAIERGLYRLASRQSERDDGSFGASGYGRNVAVCSLAGLAFLCEGSTPGRGRFGGNIDRCIDYILANAQESGYIIAPEGASHGPMYGHGFSTLFLAEVYGMTSRPGVRETLSRAVRLIVNSQNPEGGWRYKPDGREADISVTICQVMALRAARNVGVAVPSETIDRCIEYVKSMQNGDGGFMYMSDGGPSGFPRSAAGIVALHSAGVYEGEELEKGMNYLLRQMPRAAGYRHSTNYFYGHYYGAQAAWRAGGDSWRNWYPVIRDVLLDNQLRDGSWVDTISPEYGTAMACIILQIPNNQLPIFQR